MFLRRRPANTTNNTETFKIEKTLDEYVKELNKELMEAIENKNFSSFEQVMNKDQGEKSVNNEDVVKNGLNMRFEPPYNPDIDEIYGSLADQMNSMVERSLTQKKPSTEYDDLTPIEYVASILVKHQRNYDSNNESQKNEIQELWNILKLIVEKDENTTKTDNFQNFLKSYKSYDETIQSEFTGIKEKYLKKSIVQKIGNIFSKAPAPAAAPVAEAPVAEAASVPAQTGSSNRKSRKQRKSKKQRKSRKQRKSKKQRKSRK